MTEFEPVKIDNFGFKVTPKPIELTEKEIDNFGLRCYGGKELKPVYEDIDVVWAAANTGNLPIYRLYDRGTNNLLIIRYTPDKNIWEEIELSDIGNLYGFIWKMCSKLMSV